METELIKDEEGMKEDMSEEEILTEEDLEYISQCREKYELFCGKYPPNFGKAISRRERDEKELFEKNYVYSEISFDALAVAIMKIVKKYGKSSVHGSLPNSGAKFFDLGSGIGKTLIAARLVFSFASCHGVEILEGLHQAATWVHEGFQAKAAELKTFGKLPVMMLTEGDFLENVDWKSADLLFINGSCYGDEILENIMKLSMELKKGAFVVSVSYAIPSKEFELYEYTEQDMNWGKANLFIQQKITDSHEYVEPVEEEDSDEVEEEEDVESLDEDAADLAKTAVNALGGLFG